MSHADFRHSPLLPLGADNTEYRLVTDEGVDVVEGPHPEMYPQLATGEMDLFADAWLPGGHACSAPTRSARTAPR